MSVNRITHGGDEYKVTSQQKADATPGAREVKHATFGGKTYAFYTITPSEAATGFLASISRAVRGALPPKHYAVEVSSAEHLMKKGGLQELTRMHSSDTRIGSEKHADRVMRRMSTGALHGDLRERQSELQTQKALMRPLIRQSQSNSDVKGLHALVNAPHTLESTDLGRRGNFILRDAEGQPRAVIKPGDQEYGNLNNPNGFASPFGDTPELRLRPTIPNNISVQQEALGYTMAYLCGFAGAVPKTTMSILSNDQFHSFVDNLKDVPKMVEQDLRTDKEREKLVAVQEYVPNSQSLSEAVTEAAALNVPLALNQKDFEAVNCLMWILGEQNGDLGSFVAYPRADETMGLKKVDNSLICGEEKRGALVNHLSDAFPEQMNQTLSVDSRLKINAIPLDENSKYMAVLGRSDEAIAAFKRRVVGLQIFINKNPDATLKEINTFVNDHYGTTGSDRADRRVHESGESARQYQNPKYHTEKDLGGWK